AANSFWDYPNVGSSHYRWFITANDFGTTVPGAILSIDKIPTLTGSPVSVACFQGLEPNLAPPIQLDTNIQATFLSPGSGGGNTIVRYDLKNQGQNSGDALNDTVAAKPSYAIPAWTSASGAPQPNGQKLDTLDGRFQSNSIQSLGNIWNVHTVNNGGRAAIRWYSLSKTSTTSTVNAVTEFLSDDPTGHLFNPSIATGSGLLGAPAIITASRTAATAGTGNAAHLVFTGLNHGNFGWSYAVAATSGSQFATDGFGTPCNSTSRGACRWGDYSSTSMSPVSSAEAWSFNQLVTGATQFDWTTSAARGILNLTSGPDSKWAG
ncbi:MAG: hypothetical protein KDK89_20675, partial [Alphaproteobacteria bacterium]|nr:hypothetical protein [Alphaproteobacteria bacterium]